MITLTGDNQFLIKRELENLEDSLDLADDLSRTHISGQEASLEDIKSELSSYSLFSPKRLIILDEPSKAKGFEEIIDQVDDIAADGSLVVIVEPKLDKRKAYFKYLSSSTDFRSLNPLSEHPLIQWSVDYAKSLSATLSNNDARYLIDRVGEDQLLLSQEIQKLSIYSSQINRDSIDLLTEQSPSSTVFELLDAAFNLNSKKAMQIYLEQRLLKVEPEYILAMLSWQLNLLAIYMTSKNMTDSNIISSSPLTPFTLSKAKHIASKLSLLNLKTLVHELTNLDLATKTSGTDLDEGLKNFIVSFKY